MPDVQARRDLEILRRRWYDRPASVLDGMSFNPFSFQDDGLAASEVDIGRRQIGDALLPLHNRAEQRRMTLAHACRHDT